MLLCAICPVLSAAIASRPSWLPAVVTATAQQAEALPAPPPPANADENRVYLIHADELSYDRWRNNGAQVLRGGPQRQVEFYHKGAFLYCDSANFFESTNSFEAWGNVKMVQGDTLSLTSEFGRYDGDAMMMEAAGQVVLRHVTTTLYTDSLCYDRYWNTGYFPYHGRMVDGTTTLISDWGEYHTDTKMAHFFDNVYMTDQQFKLTTDSLEYNTQTKQAHVIGPSDIYSGESHIYSEQGYYNSQTGQSILLNRSVLTNNGRKLVGDSIWHDEHTGVSEAFGNVVYTDEENKNMMTCNYGFYNDSTGYALSTDSAVVMDFSERDTLYMHADTFKVFSYNLDTDSVYRVMHAYNRVRAYRTDIQAVCDSMVYSTLDSCMTMYKDPIVWNVNQQLLGEVIEVFMKDSVVDHAHVINQAFSIEDLHEPDQYNQVSSKEMFAFFVDGEIYEAQAKDNVLVVYYPVDDADSSYIGLVSMETNKLRMFMEQQKLNRIWTPKADGTIYPMTQIPPAKRYLQGFNWFDYIRPVSKEDIFVWRGKKSGTELKPQKQRTPPAKPTLPPTLQPVASPENPAEQTVAPTSPPEVTDSIPTVVTDSIPKIVTDSIPKIVTDSIPKVVTDSIIKIANEEAPPILP